MFRLIVGLGNIGVQYVQTRHNMGFMVLDALAQQWGLAFSHDSSFFAEVAKRPAMGGQLYLAKPSTYMNRSGQAVRALCQFYKILPEQVLVVHDELDLPTAGLKLKKGGGHAGHNGLRDIATQLGSADFWRLRVGIDHPRALGWTQPVADYVLHPPRNEDRPALQAAMQRAVLAIESLLKGDRDLANRQLAG